MMDDPGVPDAALHRSLWFIRLVNAGWGGRAALLGHLSRWSRDWPKGREITLLDIGTGSADLPIAAVEWARARGHALRVVAIDAHPKTLAAARERIARAGLGEWIEARHADALKLMDEFGPDAFDYAHAGLFLHHLQDVEVLTVLRMMERVSRRGIVWNDLIRSGWNRLVVGAATIGQPQIIAHDARVSVEAAFTKREVLEIRDRLGLGWCKYRANRLMGRFTLAGQVPGAWTGV